MQAEGDSKNGTHFSCKSLESLRTERYQVPLKVGLKTELKSEGLRERICTGQLGSQILTNTHNQATYLLPSLRDTRYLFSGETDPGRSWTQEKADALKEGWE